MIFTRLLYKLTETYKYYIDFASKSGIPYIIMDEGWAETVDNPYIPNKKVDLHELIRYGKEKKVDIILWLTWLSVEQNQASRADSQFLKGLGKQCLEKFIYGQNLPDSFYVFLRLFGYNPNLFPKYICLILSHLA